MLLVDSDLELHAAQQAEGVAKVLALYRVRELLEELVAHREAPDDIEERQATMGEPRLVARRA